MDQSKKGGGHNGHNGLKSIDSYIGKDYHRIKIGVGRPKIMIKDQFVVVDIYAGG